MTLWEELAKQGDLDSAVKLLKLYQRSCDRVRFEECRLLVIRLISEDETIGKWSREDKIRKIEALRIEGER